MSDQTIFSKLNYLEQDKFFEFDFKDFKKILLRNKKSIFFITFLFFIFGQIIFFAQKKLWKGEFQIVLSNSQPTSILNRSILRTLTTTNDVKTEINILKSPSVLMPVFELFKLENIEKRPALSNISYRKWFKKYISIKLVSGTTILNIGYKHDNKEFIKSSLDKISDIYKTYSIKKKDRINKNAALALNQQIGFYEKKNSETLKKAAEFANQYDLLIPGDLKNPTTKLDIERVSASNEIRYLDGLIKKFYLIKNDLEKVKNLALTIPDFDKNQTLESILEVENKLINLKSNYYESDKEILYWQQYKFTLMNSLRDEFETILNSKMDNLVALKESTKRKDGILAEFNKIVRDLYRDEKILEQFQLSLRELYLSQASNNNPWELITEPTILSKPVYPSKRDFFILSLLTGFSISILLIFIKELRSDKIISKNQLSSKLNSKILYDLTLVDQKDWAEDLKIISSNLNLKNTSKPFYFFFLGEQINKEYDNFFDKIIEYNNNKNLNKCKNLSDVLLGSSLVIITSTGNLTSRELELFNNRIKDFKADLRGYILISEKD